ncbi:hypothetical protein SOCEGT47_032770 [Sorangium cellulosum]|uniref:Uncharacterized protein n=1 Tax=Sorangium cellulosum TaxID=56 RepID=A0A4P2Q0M2_SORCE|nr:MYXO-CTERM sorting domain-containing protein [Sorangium cellulosum]AUX22767.1 hypothetical protein SOCEGT47_032770 [Sorangium cellulosum]
MPRVIKHLAAVAVLLVIAGCAASGGGCAGCGMPPLPAGFKPADRIENAGAARLTRSGIEFLEQNLGVLGRALLGGGDGGLVTFSIPRSPGSVLGGLIDYVICPDGADPGATPPACVAEIDVARAALQIDPTAPHHLLIRGPLPVRLQRLPIFLDGGLLGESTQYATLNGNDACPPDEQTFTNIDVEVELSVEIDVNPQHARQGYSRVKVVRLSIDDDRLASGLHLHCGGSWVGDALDFVKPILTTVIGSMSSTLKAQLDQQLCQKADPTQDPACPDGTNDIGGVCRYGTQSSDECASILLGVEGHLDLGRLLASISPGTTGGFDLLLAGGGASTRDDGSDLAFGDLNPVDGGLTLGLYGGVEPLPTSGCVPLSDMPLPTGIPIPDELVANTAPGWPDDLPGPHLGIAISERFANYALNGVYNSGLLCLGVSTDTVPLLNSGTLGLLAGSVRDLTLQRESQQIALVIRPQEPPRVTFGNGTSASDDPLIRVQLDRASFDFYVWSLDRFTRFMTATFDLDVPMNLAVTPEGLTPVIETIRVANGRVTNNGLLRESPESIAEALGALISGQVGQLIGSGLPSIDLDGPLSGLGLSLILPESASGAGSPGLRKLTKGQDNYLGIFAAFDVTAQQRSPRSETQAELSHKEVQAEGLRLSTMTRDNGPTARLVMSSPLDDGTRIVEYSYRIDSGAWRPFTRQRIVDLRDDWLRLPGRHVISARSRIAGAPLSLDPTPATVEMVVDVDPPVIAIGAEVDGRVPLEVRDRVSDAERAKVRVRLDGGAWSPWATAAEMTAVEVGDAVDIEVEAVDEEGNLGTARQAILRGRVPLDPSAGCGCAVAGGPSDGPSSGLWLGLAAVAAAVRLARRRGVQGAPPPRALGRWARGALAGVAVIALFGAHAGCSCGDEPTTVEAGCVAPDCTTLEHGLIGAYTSAAVAADKRTVWVAGYAEADWRNAFQWGDLVVGTWDGASVAWEAIDGVPAEPAVDATRFDVEGFRGGQTEPGDDVGLWTSIAIGPDGEPAVAYYDRTNRGLKLAQRQGDAWVVSSVQRAPNSDIGRYAKLLFVSGVPVIAYLAIEPGDDGAVTSSVRLATGESATPEEGAWRFEDVAKDEATPCRAFLCGAGARCIRTTGRCAEPLASGDCQPGCGSGQACIDEGGSPVCAEISDGSRLDTYPEAIGDYIAMAPDGAGGFGLAFYDRIRGNVMIAARSMGQWETRVVDGATPDGTDTGDVGIGTSLFIDRAGDWHLAYADGLSEGLRYARVKGGTEVAPSEVVDDGLGIDGVPFEDGQHLVGDDANVVVTAAGEVRISYQDATSGTLRLAIGAKSGDGHSWRVREIEQEGFAGAFSRILEVDGRILIANWWRVGGRTAEGDVAIVEP